MTGAKLRAYCPVCGRLVPLTLAGLTHAHYSPVAEQTRGGRVGTWCLGSGEPVPAVDQAEAAAEHRAELREWEATLADGLDAA